MEQKRCGCPDVMPQKNEADESNKVNPPTPVQFNLGKYFYHMQKHLSTNYFRIKNNIVSWFVYGA